MNSHGQTSSVVSLRRSGTARIVSLAVTMATTIFSSHFLIRTLGLAAFGVIAVFATVGSFIAFLDRGVAGGLMVQIPLLPRAKQHCAIPVLLAAANKRVRVGIGYGIGLFVVAIATQAPRRLLDLPPNVSATGLLLAFSLVMGIFIIALPLGVQVRSLDALGRADLSARYAATGAVTSVGYLIGAAAMPHRFIFLAAQPAVATLIGNFLCWREVRRRFPERLPPTPDAASNLAKTSRNMLKVQLSSAIAFNTDMVVVAIFVNSSAAGTFSLYSRVYGGLFAVIHAVLWPLWSVFGVVTAEGDIVERARLVRMTMLRLVPFALAFLGIGALFAPTMVRVISSGTVSDPTHLNVLFAIWIGCSILHTTLSLIVGASGQSAALANVHIRMAVVNLSLSMIFVTTIGITGVLLGSILATLIFAIYPEGKLVHALNANMNAIDYPKITENPARSKPACSLSIDSILHTTTNL